MLPFVILSVLGLAWASQLDTVSIPAHRKLLQLNAPSTVFNRLQYNDAWLNGGWFAETSIGEPPQALEVLLDTGSSDMWAPAAQATKCREHHCVGGTCKCIPCALTAMAYSAWSPVKYLITSCLVVFLSDMVQSILAIQALSRMLSFRNRSRFVTRTGV